MKLLKYIIGFCIGAVAGFAYYYFIGCRTGACPITGNPIISTLWGGVIGALLADTIADVLRKKKTT
ncbi:hypothetical protein JXA02_00535 [candidate division KSB1 bacterium]|nr:hypothetical protein [candidate division KSB1 bacterium]RQW11447.1 MAG: hypothetical protein EH222_00565 [candidate division KSB1 bacterium]